MSTYLAQDRTASTAVNPTGVFAGNVTRVDRASYRIWVEISRLTPGYQYGPLSFSGTEFPRVGDRVTCEFVEGRTSEIIVTGIVKTPNSPDLITPIAVTSTSRPVNPPAGTIIFETDTLQTYIWTGSSWSSIEGGGIGEVLYEAGPVDGSYSIDLALGNFHTFTVEGEVSITVSNVGPTGTLTRLSMEATMGDEFSPINWPESFLWPYGLDPLAPEPNQVLALRAYTLDGGDVWRVALPDFL
jgi:hypothetical protein